MLGVSSVAHNRPVVGGLREHALRPLGRAGRGLAALLALLAVLAVAAWWWTGRATALEQVHLAGRRSPAPVALVVLLDVSGSFAAYSGVRQDVLDQVVRWAPDNLRDDDTLSVLTFAGGADRLLATVPVGDLRRRGPAFLPSGPQQDGTRILPALAAADTPPAGRPTSLVVVTDTLVSDLDRAAVDAQVRRLGALTMTLVLPSGVHATSGWSSVFGYQQVVSADPGAADATALAVGRAIAHATGQRLARR